MKEHSRKRNLDDARIQRRRIGVDTAISTAAAAATTNNGSYSTHTGGDEKENMGANGFKGMGLSDHSYRAIVKMGYRVCSFQVKWMDSAFL
jgi:hypothetical protein